MSLLFMGGEDIDFKRFHGSAFTTTNASYFRANYARGAITLSGANSTTLENMSKADADFVRPSNDFWFTARLYVDPFIWTPSGWRNFLWFNDDNQRRLGFQWNGNTRHLRLVRFDAQGAATVIQETTEPFIASDGLHRIDVQVGYGSAGRVRFFMNQVPFIDVTTDVRSAGSTSLNGFTISGMNGAEFRSTGWSEMIVAEADTRTLVLKTHAPVATATGHEWIGSQSDVNEITLEPTTMITTHQPERDARFTVTGLPAGNYGIRGFKVSSYAARGVGGPQNLQIGVKTQGADALSDPVTVDTGWTRVNAIFETNPNTNQSWTINEINSIEIVAKSKP
jgi:hypothetical protein